MKSLVSYLRESVKEFVLCDDDINVYQTDKNVTIEIDPDFIMGGEYTFKELINELKSKNINPADVECVYFGTFGEEKEFIDENEDGFFDAIKLYIDAFKTFSIYVKDLTKDEMDMIKYGVKKYKLDKISYRNDTSYQH